MCDYSSSIPIRFRPLILLNELPEVDHILAVIAEIFFQNSGHVGDFFTELVEGFRLFGEGLRGQFRGFQS